jgi:hypothetical protein
MTQARMHLRASVLLYLCASACGMRKSFDVLHALVTQSMELDAFAGHLFVFASRRRDWKKPARCRSVTPRRAARDRGCRVSRAAFGHRSEPGEAPEAIPKKHRRSRINIASQWGAIYWTFFGSDKRRQDRGRAAQLCFLLRTRSDRSVRLVPRCAQPIPGSLAERRQCASTSAAESR